jgi:hypothetical protein
MHRLFVLSLPLLAVAACATPGEQGRYSRDFDRLTAECAARDGILVHIPGATTGRPETDYACQIRGASGMDRLRR